jgi:2-dehydropantoate 2-reductase
MRILVVGAGAIGGYYGGRLLEAKQDVTFLVRPRRAAELAASGLEIRSPNGDVTIAHPPTVLTENIHGKFDLILLSCKAYDLDSAIVSLAPAVGEQTLILPLLNGMRHLDVLDQRFGASHVLGGLCMISTTVEPGGRVVHFNKLDALVFGARSLDAQNSANVTALDAIAAAFAAAGFESRLSHTILHDMWEKWVFIASCAGITCLMRATIGDIVAADVSAADGGAADGAALALTLLNECSAIAASHGFAPRTEAMQQSRATLSKAGSPLVASMFRDIERHAPTEAEHMIGDLLHRGAQKSIASPMLRVVYVHLQSYAARRAREASQG